MTRTKKRRDGALETLEKFSWIKKGQGGVSKLQGFGSTSIVEWHYRMRMNQTFAFVDRMFRVALFDKAEDDREVLETGELRGFQ